MLSRFSLTVCLRLYVRLLVVSGLMIKHLRFYGSLLLLTLMISIFANYGLAAEEQGEYLKYQEPQSPTTSWLAASGYVISLMLTFLLVLGLAYFTSRFLAQKMNRTAGLGGGKIHTSLPLGPNRTICVVEIAGKFMVLGVTEHNISLLKELTAPEDVEQFQNQMNSELSPEKFASVFHRQLLSLKQLNKKIPAVFGSETSGISEKEHENGIRKR